MKGSMLSAVNKKTYESSFNIEKITNYEMKNYNNPQFLSLSPLSLALEFPLTSFLYISRAFGVKSLLEQLLLSLNISPRSELLAPNIAN